MGWFDTEIENVFYSDETLDLAFNFINEFSQAYQKDLKRKPTVEELEYLLKLSFRVNVDNDILADFEEKKIDDVRLKVIKRKKKLKYEVGDMCAIPLKCGGYAFSRILILQPPSWHLSEIFAYYSKDKTYTPNIEKSGYLLYPMFITPYDYNFWRSEVVHKIPNYKSPKYDELRYYYGIDGNYTLTKVGEDYGKHITEEEAKQYTKTIFYHPVDILNMIENALKENNLIIT